MSGDRREDADRLGCDAGAHTACHTHSIGSMDLRVVVFSITLH